jgi:hypothetical protein
MERPEQYGSQDSLKELHRDLLLIEPWVDFTQALAGRDNLPN